MVDIASQLGAVDRGIRTTDIDGVTSYVQTLDQTYPSPIDDVWDALTTTARIARWFLPVSGDLTLGGRYQFEGNAGGEVLSCEPPAAGVASFRVSWGMGPGTDTYLTIRLTGDGERTHLELEHVAAADILPPGMWEQFGPAGTGMGWDSGLLGLSLHLAHPSSATSSTRRPGRRATRVSRSCAAPPTPGPPPTRPAVSTRLPRRLPPTRPSGCTPARSRGPTTPPRSARAAPRRRAAPAATARSSAARRRARAPRPARSAARS